MRSRGSRRRRRRPRGLGIELVPAIEMSCVHEYAEDLHICGYWVDLGKIGPACERAQKERVNRAEEIVGRLRERGFDLNLEDAVTEAGDALSIGRPHIARAAGATGDLGPFFEEYLVPGAKAFVPRRWPTAEQAIALIHEAGGVAVIAHPYWDISEPDRGRGPDPLPRRRRRRDLLPDPHQGADRTPPPPLRRAGPRPHRLLRLPRPHPQDLLQVRRLRHLRPRRAAGPARGPEDTAELRCALYGTVPRVHSANRHRNKLTRLPEPPGDLGTRATARAEPGEGAGTPPKHSRAASAARLERPRPLPVPAVTAAAGISPRDSR